MKDMIDDGSALVTDRIFTVYFNMIQWLSFTFSSSIAFFLKKKNSHAKMTRVLEFFSSQGKKKLTRENDRLSC
jgi:hypothetical protein